MLSLDIKRRHILAAVVVVLTLTPVVFFTAKKINDSGVSAVDYTMPAGFNDQIFYNAIVDEFKNEFPNEVVPSTGLTDVQLAKIKYLKHSGVNGDKITDVSGLEKLTGLTTGLDLQWNNISTIDLSHNVNLTKLDLEKNNLITVDLSLLTELVVVTVSNNQLTTLDFSNNTKLKELYAKGNQLSSIDFANNFLLEKVDLYNNLLTTINVSNRSALRSLEVHNNQLTSLNISNDPALEKVEASFNQLRSLDITNDTALKELNLHSNYLSSLDLSTNTALEYLNIDTVPISTIDLTHNPNLKTFIAPADNFSSFDFSNNPLLENVVVNKQSNNALSSIDLSHNPNLKTLEIYENNLSTLDLSNNTQLQTVVARNNSLNTITLPNSSTVTTVEVKANNLTALDVSNCPGLTSLIANNNSIASIDLSNNAALVELNVRRNSITELDVSNNPALSSLTVDDIPIKAIVKVASFGDVVQFSFSDLKFLKNSQTISNTSDYTYNSSSKLVTATNSSNVFDSVRVTSGALGMTYDIVMPVFLGFDVNGGANGPDAIICYPSGSGTNCAYDIPASAPSRENYVFLGWANSATAHTKDYSAGDSVSKNGYAVLYAVWSPIYTLSFGLNGGSSSLASQTCHPATDITASCNVAIPNSSVTKENYVFLGWANSATANTAVYASGGTISLNANKTIYAVWSPIYTLSFNLKGGTSDIVSQTCYPDTNITNGCEVSIPDNAIIKEDNTFYGFATTATARVPEYVAGDNYTFVGGGNRNATLYAIFGNNDTDWVDGQEYVKGVDDGITVTVNRPLNSLERVLIDGVEVPVGQYTVDENTGEVFIKGTYLDLLPVGEHTLRLEFSDGTAIELIFTIVINHATDPEDNEAKVEFEPSDDGKIILNLTTPKVPVASITIDIYDDQGNLVKTIEISDPVNPARIDVSDLPDGDYVAEITHKDIDGNILLVTREEFTVPVAGGGDIVSLPVQTEVDVTEWIVIEIFDDNGDLVRTVKVEIETGTVYVYDEDNKLIDTIENGYENGRIVLPMDGLPSGDYDLNIYFLTKELREVGALDVEDANYIAEVIPVPDTGRFVEGDNGEGNGIINILTVLAIGVTISIYGIKRFLAKKNYLTF